MTTPRRRTLQVPIWAQIVALLLGSLVVAQIATVGMAVVLPLQPLAQYRLSDIAAALKGGPLKSLNLPPLQRAWQAEPPATTSPGWQVSMRARHDLAALMGVEEADVRLLFYSPPPFAGTAPPPPTQHRPQLFFRYVTSPANPHGEGVSSNALSRRGAGRVVDASLLPLLMFAPPGGMGGGFPGGRGGGPGGGFPGGGFPGGGRGPGGGGRGGGPSGQGDYPGGGESSGVRLDPPVSPVVLGAPDGSDGPASGDRAPPPPDGPIATAPQPAGRQPVLPPQPRPSAVAQAAAAAPVANLPAAAQPSHAAAPHPSHVARDAEAEDAHPAETLAAPPGPSLFGFAQAPSVRGEFVAALRTGSGRWEIVRPAHGPLISAWQRRVLLWFALVFAAVAPIGYLFARRLAAPLANLADAADRLGRDPSTPIRVGGGSAEIERVAAAFTGMQARLQRYVEDRTAMVGAISHDLRTPLARMRFRLEKAPAALRAGMLHDVGQMEEMVSAVLAFIRDAAEPGLRERVDLRSILECVVDDAALTGRDATLAPGSPTPVEVDISAVQRLLTNLVENALKYGHQAEVRLTAEGEEAVVRIADDGPGLPDGELERVFMPFYRSSQSRTLNAEGIGLGLSVARSIARAHGGDVALRRAPRGLVAEVRLPLAQTPASPRPALTPAVAATARETA